MSESYWLDAGPHEDPVDGRCAMEWVAYLAGEEHTDHPRCVSTFLNQLFVKLNDSLSNDDRQRLRPYLARTIGTADDDFDVTREAICRAWIERHRATWIFGIYGDKVAASLAGPAMLAVYPTSHAVAFVVAEYPSLRDEVWELLDRLLPKELIELPKVENWQAVCQVG